MALESGATACPCTQLFLKQQGARVGLMFYSAYAEDILIFKVNTWREGEGGRERERSLGPWTWTRQGST